MPIPAGSSSEKALPEGVSVNPDLKTLVLRMIHAQQGNLDRVAAQTGLPQSMLYYWLAEWQLTQQINGDPLPD